MSPEVIRGMGYGFSCDWWSLGIIGMSVDVARRRDAGVQAIILIIFRQLSNASLAILLSSAIR